MRYDQFLITIRRACSISADLYDNYLYLYVLSILSYLSCGDFSRASRCGLGTCNRSCCKECLAGGQVRPVPQLARQAAQAFARAPPFINLSKPVCLALFVTTQYIIQSPHASYYRGRRIEGCGVLSEHALCTFWPIRVTGSFSLTRLT